MPIYGFDGRRTMDGATSVYGTDARIADRVEKILGIRRVERQPARDAQQPAAQRGGLAGGHFYIHNAGGSGHLAVPAADRVLDEHERAGLLLVAQRVHEPG